MKEKFIQKLNFIPPLGSLKQGLSFHQNSSEELKYQHCEVTQILKESEEKIAPSVQSKAEKAENEGHSSLSDYNEKCPLGGSDSVILYDTSLTSIRKTFGDCKVIRFLLESFGVLFNERNWNSGRNSGKSKVLGSYPLAFSLEEDTLESRSSSYIAGTREPQETSRRNTA